LIRLNFVLRKLPHLGLEEFQQYWREQHGPLVASFQHTLGMRRYVQSHTLDDALSTSLREARTGMHDPFDGIASVWWDTREELAAAFETEAGRRAAATLLEDERKFIDLSRSALWVAREVPQINPMPENGIVATPESSWVKFCYVLNPPADTTVAACQLTWQMDHGYLIRRHSEATRFHRYIQSHTLDDSLNETLRESRNAAAPYAGLTEAWFNRYDLEQCFAHPEGEAARAFGAFLEDEKRFIDFSRSSLWGAKERVFVDRR
jgi:uncharacterized protein (TIGR02118 family)